MSRILVVLEDVSGGNLLSGWTTEAPGNPLGPWLCNRTRRHNTKVCRKEVLEKRQNSLTHLRTTGGGHQRLRYLASVGPPARGTHASQDGNSSSDTVESTASN